MDRTRVIYNSYNPMRIWRWHAPYWQEIAACVILGIVIALVI